MLYKKKWGLHSKRRFKKRMAHFAIGSLSFSKRGQLGVVKENSRIFQNNTKCSEVMILNREAIVCS